VDVPSCRDAVAAAHGEAVATMLVVVPTDDIPLTEQGKPDRSAILAHASS
jgi:fatty-acyl-CoA synthase